MNSARLVQKLIESIGLPAPTMGETNDTAMIKIIDALEKLIQVARAAAASRWSAESAELREALDELSIQDEERQI